MARSGSFGGSLNPFGTGSLGGFSQYDIAGNLAELEVYRVEVAWGNGTATDDEYVAALKKALDATSPDTRDRESAQNRLDDALYRIGRSKAGTQGLDALIAFDQSALAKMNQSNLRYRDVKDSLDSELAQRRSRDYGKLVQEYNAGKIPTQKLVDWVQQALGTISPDDPDYANWTGTRQELDQRVKSEKDEKVYQDYQMGRMKGPAFLSYIQGRLNEYDPSSPDYADWQRRFEDAKKQVKNADLARQDTAFFNAYEEGHKSDAQYLSYLRKRLDGMDPNDPDRAAWKHRLNQAAFSLAEDKLRFDVERGKQPVSKLITFYRNYQRTLNPGSQEYRQIARNLRSLGSGGGGGHSGGGGGRRSGGGSSSGGGGSTKLGTANAPKAISIKSSLHDLVSVLTVNVSGSKGAQRTGTKALDLNIDSLQNARQRGDSVWLFQDPRHPGQMVPGQYPDGRPMKDSAGKPVMVPGSAYLPVTDDAYVTLLGLKTQLHYDLAGKALADHDSAGYFYQLKLATNNEDRIRLVNQQAVDAANRKFYDAADDGIDMALRTGDFATAINLAKALQGQLDAALSDPMLDDTRRATLERLSQKLSDNPLLPKVMQMPDGSLQEVGGAIDLDNSSFDKDGNATYVALKPGWHYTLDGSDKNGAATWGLQFDDLQDGTWEQNHMTVHASFGGRVVTGEVKVRTAPFNNTMFANTPDGMVRLDAGGQFISFTDEHGRQVKAYSLDGQTWVRSTTGLAPSLQLDADLQQVTDQSGTHFVDKATNELVFTKNKDGSVTKNDAYFEAHPDAADFYGMKDLKKRRATLGRVQTQNADGSMRQGQYVSGYEEQYLYATGRSGLKGKNGPAVKGGTEVGGPGQYMQVITKSDSGRLNLTDSQDPFHALGRDTGIRGNSKRPNDGDSFAYGVKTGSSTTSGRKATNPLSLNTPARKARAYGESLSDLSGPVTSGRYGPPTPPIKSQLPADTPDRYDGVGLRGYTGMPQQLKFSGPAPSLKSKTAASLPPKVKTKTPLPKPKPTTTAPKRPLPKPTTVRRTTVTRPKTSTKPRTSSTIIAGRNTAL